MHNKLYIDDYDWLRYDQGRLSTNENRSNIAICNHDRTKDFSNLDFFVFIVKIRGFTTNYWMLNVFNGEDKLSEVLCCTYILLLA